MSDTTKHVKVTKGRTVAVTQTSLKNNDLGAVPRDELEKEVSTLRTMVEAMKRSATIDTVSGLANRKSFLDAANAEFNRTRRYGHELTLCVVDIIGLSKINRDHGLPAADHVVMAVAQMSTSSSRLGVDVLGRISENQIAIILPETPLAGGLKFMQRMRKIGRHIFYVSARVERTMPTET